MAKKKDEQTYKINPSYYNLWDRSSCWRRNNVIKSRSGSWQKTWVDLSGGTVVGNDLAPFIYHTPVLRLLSIGLELRYNPLYPYFCVCLTLYVQSNKCYGHLNRVIQDVHARKPAVFRRPADTKKVIYGKPGLQEQISLRYATFQEEYLNDFDKWLVF